MPNIDWLLQCVEDKMDVYQDFTDNPRKFMILCNNKALKNIKIYEYLPGIRMLKNMDAFDLTYGPICI